MKVLLTGGTGQIGLALQKRAPVSWELVAPSRDRLDLASDASIHSFIDDFRPALVINAAAYTDVEKAEVEPTLANRLNGEAPGILSRAAARVGGRLLHLSTDYVFDGESESPYPPDARCNPLSAYGRSKLAGERSVLGTDMIVRTAWVYGLAGRNFLNAMLGRLRNGETLRVVADQFGNPTWSHSIANALIELVEAGSSGIFHFTDQGQASWYEFATEIGRVGSEMGILSSIPDVTPVKTSEYNQRASRPPNSVLDCDKTYKELTTLPLSWQDNLKIALEEFEAAY